LTHLKEKHQQNNKEQSRKIKSGGGIDYAKKKHGGGVPGNIRGSNKLCKSTAEEMNFLQDILSRNNIGFKSEQRGK